MALISMAALVVLSVIVAVGLVKIFPVLHRSARNVEKITESIVEVAPDIVATSKNLRETTEHLSRSAGNVEKVTEGIAEAAPDIVVTSKNLRETTEHLRNAAKDVCGATRLLQFLGPAGAAVNIGNQGIGRLGRWIADQVQRIRR